MPKVAATTSAVSSGTLFTLKFPLPLVRASLSASSIHSASKAAPEVTTTGVMSAEVNCSPRAMCKLIMALKIGLSFCSNVDRESETVGDSREATRRMWVKLLFNSNAQLSVLRRVFACVIARQRPETACSSSYH